MGAEQVFKVLTEFRFDIAHAVAGSQQLQGQLGQVSAAADELHYALKRASMGLVVQTGLGTGGVLGFLYKAVQVSDKFYQSQLKLSSIMMSNHLFTGDNAFEKSMAASETALENMSVIAKQFSLPSNAFVEMATGIGAVLSVKGLDDAKLTKSTDITRAFMKSAPVLGIDPAMYQQNLLDMIMGQGSMGDRMSQRIMAETPVMKQFGGSMSGFNALEPAKRLQILTEALGHFSKNTKVNEAVVNSLSGQMRKLSDNFTSIFAITKNIGNAIAKPIIMILKRLNEYIETHGKKIADTISRVLGDLLKDPEKLFTQIEQLRNLQKDTKMAGNILGIIALVEGLSHALKFFGVTLRGGLIVTAFSKIVSGIAWVVTSLGGAMAIFSVVLKGLWFIASKVVAPLVLLTTILQGISRGIAGAKIADMKWLAAHGAQIAEIFEKFKNAIQKIFLPFELAIRGIAMFVEWFLSFGAISEWALGKISGLVDMMETLGNIMVTFFGIIAGISNIMVNAIMNLLDGNFLAAGQNIGANFMEGFNDFTSEFWGKRIVGAGEQSVSTNKIEIDKIEINNQFKENAEPDRIAFTLKDQLMKAALNPTQAAGGSLRGKGIAF